MDRHARARASWIRGCLLGALVACGRSPTEVVPPSDAPAQDALSGPDAALAIDAMPEMADACVPAICHGACGTQPDGCGGTIDCGECCSAELAGAAEVKPGFPVEFQFAGGSGRVGPVNHVLVADVRDAPGLEVVVWGHGGPVFVIGASGAILANTPRAVHPMAAAGPVVAGGRDELVVNHLDRTDVYAGGVEVPGWPADSANYETMPPALVDVDGDGDVEVFRGSEIWTITGFDGDGTPLPGFPLRLARMQQTVSTPAVGDIDGDGDVDLVTLTDDSVFVVEHDGVGRPGFPASTGVGPNTHVTPAIGDVDGDGAKEIVVSGYDQLAVIGLDGRIERQWTIPAPVTGRRTALALADIDGDAVLDIVIQSEGWLSVYRHTSAGFVDAPGWPQAIDPHPTVLGDDAYNSSPVVGDLDGVPGPEIAVTVSSGGQPSSVYVFHADGTPLRCYPKVVQLGPSATPAIADIDLDGRSELLITGEKFVSSNTAWVWALSLAIGPTEPPLWGMYGHDAAHTFHAP